MVDKNMIYKFFTSKVDFNKKSPLVKEYIRQFYTDNVESLTSDGFTKRIVFGANKKSSILEIYGVDPKDWAVIVKQSHILQIGEQARDLLNQLLVMHYIVTEDPVYLKFLSIKLFTSKYYRGFPIYIKEAKMKAVIDSLSNKFYIKKHGTLDKALDATVNTYKITYANRFNKATDDDIVYIINALATRVGILVRNVQRKYYNAPDNIGFFEDKEIMEKDNKRLTTNDTVVYEQIISTVKTNELTYSFDKATLRQLQGVDYIDVFKAMYINDRDKVSLIIVEVFNDFLKKNNSPSLKFTHDNFLKLSFNAKDRSPKLLALIDELGVKYKVANSIKFRDVVVKYYSVKIYKEILKEVI